MDATPTSSELVDATPTSSELEAPPTVTTTLVLESSKSSESAPPPAAEEDCEVEDGAGDDEDGEVDFVVGNDDSSLFDKALTCLEECITSAAFRDPLVAFCRRHCGIFDPLVEEQTLEHMALFRNYTDLVEGTIKKKLEESFGEEISLEDVESIFASQDPATLNGDVFDVLVGLGDYEEFRSLMSSYREEVYSSSSSSSSPRLEHIEGVSVNTTSSSSPSSSSSSSSSSTSTSSSSSVSSSATSATASLGASSTLSDSGGVETLGSLSALSVTSIK